MSSDQWHILDGVEGREGVGIGTVQGQAQQDIGLARMLAESC